jgi:hypothetical protein
MLRIVPHTVPVSAAHTSIFQMDSNSTSYFELHLLLLPLQREICIDNLLVRVQLIIEMILVYRPGAMEV